MKNIRSVILKSVFTLILCAAILCAAFLPASAESSKTMSDRVKDMLRSQVVLDDFYKLVEAVDKVLAGGDPMEVFQTFLEIYPDFVTEVKRSKDSALGDQSATGNDGKYQSAVNEMIKNQVIFDDLAKFITAVDDGDGGKIMMAVLEIYPDFVVAAKKALEKESPVAESLTMTVRDDETDPDTLYFILTGVGGVVVGSGIGALTVYFAFRKRGKHNGAEST